MNSLDGSYLPKAERPFGDYELLAKLATGGMAEIFLARRQPGAAPLQAAPDSESDDDAESEDESQELVVIKRVLPHLLEESRFIAMFRDEARLASQILHPNVCRVFDSGRVDGTYFIAMEYLHGVPLSRVMLRAARTKQHLSTSFVVGLLIQCCNGLHHAHELKSRDGRLLDVVHRDVSPPNIFVTTDGLAKLLDFGVAKARGASQKTRTGTVKGKNSYMSPEQILGQEVDRRSDVFSLGIVLWEALTSKRLFSRETDFLTFTAITETDIEDVREIRPEINDALAEVVKKALARDRDDRYSTAQELSLALWQANEGEEEYASEITIGEYIRQRFSKELLSVDDLSANLSTEGDVDSDAAPQLENENGDAPDLSLPTPPAAVMGSILSDETSKISAIRGMEGAPSGLTDAEAFLQNKAGERKRLVVAVGLAVTLTAGLAFLLLGGSDSTQSSGQEPSSADASEVTLILPPSDAQVAALPPASVDAGVPDAKPTPIAPEVDKRPAYLTVDSSPYATIYVDGKKLGVTPIFKVKLAPGKHKLKAVSATGAKQTIRLNLRPGRTKNLGRLKWK